MATLIRSTDWVKTPLGPVGNWSSALRMMVSFLLANRFPNCSGGVSSSARYTTTPISPLLARNIPGRSEDRLVKFGMRSGMY